MPNNSDTNVGVVCNSMPGDCVRPGVAVDNRLSSSKTKPRLDYIDNLRVLACFLVLLTHSTMPADASDGFWVFGLSFIGSPSSELFLALSGTVLLPVKTGFRQFYSRRFLKLLPPLLIWSVLGVLLYVYMQKISWTVALNSILRIPLQPTIGVYWFVYVMAGLYFLAPIISPWLRSASKRQIEFFLLLWLINMSMPWITFFYPDFTHSFIVNGNYYWQLCYFGGFLGYWILGYYLRKYPIHIGLNVKWMSLLMISVAYPIAIFLVKSKGLDTLSLLDNLQIGSAAIVALLYTLMQNIKVPDRLQTLITGIAKYSFCIYLTHIYIARELYWGIFNGTTIHIFPRTFMIAALTLLTGYLITWLLTFIPKGKYITGT